MAKTIAVADEQSNGQAGLGTRIKGSVQRSLDFFGDVRAEMRKVVTPSREEVQSTTTIVILTVFIFAGYFALVDFAIGNGVTQLIQHFTKH